MHLGSVTDQPSTVTFILQQRSVRAGGAGGGTHYTFGAYALASKTQIGGVPGH